MSSVLRIALNFTANGDAPTGHLRSTHSSAQKYPAYSNGVTGTERYSTGSQTVGVFKRANDPTGGERVKGLLRILHTDQNVFTNQDASTDLWSSRILQSVAEDMLTTEYAERTSGTADVEGVRSASLDEDGSVERDYSSTGNVDGVASGTHDTQNLHGNRSIIISKVLQKLVNKQIWVIVTVLGKTLWKDRMRTAVLRQYLLKAIHKVPAMWEQKLNLMQKGAIFASEKSRTQYASSKVPTEP